MEGSSSSLRITLTGAKSVGGMPDLEPPDTHFLSAAIGWMELGLQGEAFAELNRLSPAAQRHPDVLAIHWDLCAQQGRWMEALQLATAMIESDEASSSGWINRSFALHELRRTDEAQSNLIPALSRFPTNGIIRYNLACYACILGQLDQARRWLREAMLLEGREVVVGRARQDPDLATLAGELDNL